MIHGDRGDSDKEQASAFSQMNSTLNLLTKGRVLFSLDHEIILNKKIEQI